MNNRDVNQDQIADEKNSAPLSTLPNEIIIGMAEQLPPIGIQSLRHTCHFFRNNTQLKKIMDRKTIHQVITTENCTFWFKNGKVFGSGSNYFNALGLGKGIGSCFDPTEIILPSNKPIARIATAHEHIFYFDIDGDCFFCGSNTCGQLGNSDSIEYSFKTMRLPNGSPIIDVAVGHVTSFLRDDKGYWYGMGDNDCGKLGINSRVRFTDTPIQISLPNGLPITKIMPGQHHTFFQDIEDHWFHCGDGKVIGKPDYTYAPESFTLPDNKPIVEIVTILGAIFIRNNESQWYICGDNRYKQLGTTQGSDRMTNPPIRITQLQLPNGKSIDKIVTSGHHTFMLDIDGQWFGCGSNAHGQLLFQKSPHFSSHIELTPIELPNHKPIIEVRTGSDHTLLKDNEGNWYGCGSNSHGQLGPNKFKKVDQLFYIDATIFEKANEKVEETSLLQSSLRNSY